MATYRPASVRNETMIELEREMASSTPQRCVSLSHSAPSVQVYYALRTKLEQSTETWLREFLELDGLDGLLASLSQMSGKGFTSFSDAILQLDCISCIRTILNNSVGLNHMILSQGYTRRLAQALDTCNTLPKKQVIELLSAICAYSELGYHQVIDALEHLKHQTDQTHRFSIIVNELRISETVAHKTAILTLINCLINCNPELVERNRIRNELIGMDLLDVLTFLRKEETDADLHLQLQVFHEKKHEDEDLLNQDWNLDFNSPQDLLDLIQSKVFGSPRMVCFVNVLQDFLTIETVYTKNSDKLWKSIDNLVHQIIHTCDDDTLDKLSTSVDDITTMVTIGPQCSQCQHYCETPSQRGTPTCIVSHSKINCKKSTSSTSHTSNTDTHDKTVQCLDNTKYDNVSGSDIEFIDRTKCEDSGDSGVSISAEKSDSLQKTNKAKVEVPEPTPGKKIKRCQWVKIPENDVAKTRCIWTPPGGTRNILPDYAALEKMFHDTRTGFLLMDEVTLLNSKTRMDINLFLSRLEMGPEDLVESIEHGDLKHLTVPVLKYLLEILPSREEIAMLQSYTGHRLELGMAEQFVLLLGDIPSYDILLHGLHTKADFAATVTKLKSSLNAMVDSCRVILENPELKELLHLMLQTGNFMNFGEFNGDACGISLASLLRLVDVKSRTHPGRSLLHQLVSWATEADSTMLLFIVELLPLERAASYSIENLREAVGKVNKQVMKLAQDLRTAHHHVRNQFSCFMENVRNEFAKIQGTVAELKLLTDQMAAYFCEDKNRFELQQCLQCLNRFCKQLRKCQEENEMMQKQCNMPSKKSDQLKGHLKSRLLALEFGRDAGASSSVLEEKNSRVVEKILNDLHEGNFKPVIKSEVPTPDTELHPLEFSHISFVGSPIKMRRGSDAIDDEVFSLPSSPSNFRIKVLTSSEDDLLADKPKAARPRVQSSTSRPQTLSLASAKVTRKHSRAKYTQHSHHRSRSDLGESICIENKWVMYEEIRQKEALHVQPAPLAEPESMCVISSLTLENHGKFVEQEDVKEYGHKNVKTENICKLEPGPILKLPDPNSKPSMKKGDSKRSLGGFLNKLSRAVLRPKNVYVCYSQNESPMQPGAPSCPGKGESKVKPRKGSKGSSKDKENIDTRSKVQTHAEKKYALKEYKRFQAEKAQLAALKYQ